MKKLYFLLLIFTPFWVYSQDSILTINDLYIDFAIPDVSAFNMLGETPQNISKPGNIKDFSAQVLNIASSGKSITPGIAIEVNPYLIFNNNSQVKNQIGKYRKSKFKGFQLTFGTLQDSSGSKIAYGLKWTLFDKADPLNNPDFQNEIIAMQMNYLNGRPDNAYERNILQEKISVLIDSLEQRYSGSIQYSELIKNYFLFPKDKDYIVDDGGYANKIREVEKFITTSLKIDNLKSDEKKNLDEIVNNYYEIIKRIRIYENQPDSLQYPNLIKSRLIKYRKETWNKAAMHIGLGHVLQSYDYTWEHLNSNRLSYFVNVKHPIYNSKGSKYGVGMIWQVVGNNYFKVDSSDTKILFSAGNRIIVGQDFFRISLENMFTFLNKEKQDNISYYRATLGFEFQISEGAWLEMAFGINKKINEIKATNSFLSLMNFKYTIGKERRYN